MNPGSMTAGSTFLTSSSASHSKWAQINVSKHEPMTPSVTDTMENKKIVNPTCQQGHLTEHLLHARLYTTAIKDVDVFIPTFQMNNRSSERPGKLPIVTQLINGEFGLQVSLSPLTSHLQCFPSCYATNVQDIIKVDKLRFSWEVSPLTFKDCQKAS